ncbi:cytochrome P450 [Lophiostoma macrostomum CBS 122681]|uniref:Cytochrome P450 n=1 Tax=Lophiostoma macrostomum CBS 122681 TaxID=1314788 RepID=A0A6A6SRE7_9PLEO|nr:cytochrome P450 [Lophiostoma macrostomum CBS 122681]
MHHLSLLSAITAALTLIAYPVINWVYYAFFHPLAKIPGPRKWGASRLPFVKSFLQGTIIQDIESLHRQYGPILRVGPDEVTFAHPDAWSDILQIRPNHQQLPKDPLWWSHPGPTSILSAIDAQTHARIRRALVPGFTERALRAQEPILLHYVDLLIERLREILGANPTEMGDGIVINILPWLNFTTFDIFGDLGFGEPFNCLQHSEYHPWIAMLFNSVKASSFVSAAKFYPLINWILLKCIPPSLRKMQDDHFRFIAEKVERRMNWEMERSDLIEHTLKEAKEGKGMSRGEIDSTFAILATAGSETTATVLGGIVNYLSINPDKSNILVHKIRSKFESESEINMESVKDFPYLNAVIHEGLRLCPPVPWIMPRLVPAGGDTVCGTWLPGGTRVSIQAYSLHRDPNCFYSASSFIPERWLTEEYENQNSPFHEDKREVVQTFSVGPRSCLGKSLAWSELQLILVRLLWAFDIGATEGKQLRWEDLRTFLLVEKLPIEVTIKKRAF